MTETITTSYEIQLLDLPADDALTEAQAALLDPARAALGFVPNMYRSMANQPAMLATYLDGYHRFRAETNFSSAEQEVVLLAISYDNECRYCTAAHSMLAEHVSGVPPETLAAIHSGDTIADEKLRALHAAATAVSASRGRPSKETIDAFLAAGYTETDLLSIVLAVSVKVISNYTNHLFDTPVDEAFASYA